VRARLGLIGLAAIGLAACTTATGAAPSFSAVHAIVAAYSQENNRANEVLSVRLQNRDEEGPAAEIDDANFVLARRAGFATVSGQRYEPFFEHLDEEVAGGGSRYPRTILTIDTPYTTSLKTASRVCRFAGVFVKNHPTSPWRVADEPTVNRVDVPRVVSGSSAAGSQPLVVPLGRLPRYYAIAFTTYFQQGVLSRGIAPSVFRSDAACWSLPNLSHNPFLASNGSPHVITATTVSARDPDQISFATADGGELSFFAVRVDIVSSALDGSSLGWRHRRGQPSSYLLPVGSGFKRVDIPLLFDLAVFDPPVGNHQLAPRVVGAYWGPLTDATASVKAVRSV